MSPNGVWPVSLGRLSIANFPIYLAREQHPISIIWQKRILCLVKGLEIIGVPHTYRRAVITVAPRDVVSVFEPAHPWVVSIHEPANLCVFAPELNSLRFQLPVDTVCAHPCMKLHISGCIVAAKNASEPALKGHYSAVEYAVHVGRCVARDDGVPLRTPDHFTAVLRAFFPGDIGQFRADQLCLQHSSLLLAAKIVYICSLIALAHGHFPA